MKRTVQAAGAIVTSGLLFWPAHAEAPAADALGAVAVQVSATALQLRTTSSTAALSVEQKLRLNVRAAAADEVEDDTAGAAAADDGAEYDAAGTAATDGAEDAAEAARADPSDAANEIPVEQPTPATYAPEQGVTAAEEDRERSKFKISTGFDYSSGNYGSDTDTTMLFIPLSGEYETRSWKFKVTVPWLRIDGLSSVVGGTDGGTQTGDADDFVERSGLGDVVGSVTYKIPPLGDGAPFIDLTGKVKFPTASRDDFLGTGEFDFTAQLDVFQAFGDLTLFATIGYRVLGDPDAVDLNNGILASGGFAYKFSDRFSGGGILDWREASTDTTEGPLEAVPYVVWKVHEDWSLQAYGVFGFSDGSPEAGGGLQISYTFD